VSGASAAAVRVKDLGGLLLYGPGARVVQRLPRAALPPLAHLGGALRARLGVADYHAEAVALARWCARDSTPEALVREALALQLFNELEVLRYPAITPANLHDTCVVEGRDHLEAARAQRRGVLLVLAHFGANQLVMPALGHLGIPLHQLGAPPTAWLARLEGTRTTTAWARVQARRWELEQALPARHIDVFGFLRPAFAALAANEVVAVAIDGGGGRRWAQVPFLGRTATLSTQSVELATRTGAAMVPAVVLRRPGDTRHRVILLPAVPPAADAAGSLARLATGFEPWIARAPAHYLPFLALRRRVGRLPGEVPLFAP
jgi:KDO2-lipid IV(A) lauroyltransferase